MGFNSAFKGLMFRFCVSVLFLSRIGAFVLSFLDVNKYALYWIEPNWLLTSNWLDGPGFASRPKQEIFFSPKPPRPAPEPTQSHRTGALSLG